MVNIASAIHFNNGRHYSKPAVAYIQKMIGVAGSGNWDTASINAVSAFQKARPALGTPDGKVGPKTLGSVIKEYQKLNRTVEVGVLDDYPHQMPSNIPFYPIQRFEQRLTQPFRFEQFKKGGYDGWRAVCQFDVELDLDPRLTGSQAGNYEYRQYISGAAWYRYGAGGTWGEWVEVDAKEYDDTKKAFTVPAYAGAPAGCGLPEGKVPGVGLVIDRQKEDGVTRSGVPVRYGYRNGVPVNKDRERDVWLGAHALTSLQYRARDMPSISMGKAFSGGVDAIEVWMEFNFQGFVVEMGPDPVTEAWRVLRVVESKTWKCHQLGNLVLKKWQYASLPVGPADH